MVNYIGVADIQRLVNQMGAGVFILSLIHI